MDYGLWGSAAKTKSRSIEMREKYKKNPKLCNICGGPISFERKRNKTCSMACTIEQVKLSKQKNGTVFVENGQGRSRSRLLEGIFL